MEACSFLVYSQLGRRGSSPTPGKKPPKKTSMTARLKKLFSRDHHSSAGKHPRSTGSALSAALKIGNSDDPDRADVPSARYPSRNCREQRWQQTASTPCSIAKPLPW